MPKETTIERAREDEREGKAPSTQAGEFVHEEIELIRKGAHGVRSTKQAIAIGLSKARRAGVKLPPPKRGSVPDETRTKAKQDLASAESGAKRPSRKRSQATLKALRREGRSAVSKKALAKQARAAARRRTPAEKSAAAKKAARTRRRK